MDANKIDNLIHDLDKIGREHDKYEYGLPTYNEYAMTEMRNVIQSYTQDDKSAKMLAVLKKLVDSFPEMDTDEPIAGSDAVDILCGMWEEIKEAIK